MNPIIRIDGTTQEIRLGLDRGCSAARLRMATLTVQRSGSWPKIVRTYEERVTPCGVQRVAVDTEVQPPEFIMAARAVDDAWRVTFIPSQEWLDAEDGRYTGVFSTACGDVRVEFQKGSTARGRNATPAPLPCGEMGATCEPQPPAPPLSLPTYTAIYRISGWTRFEDGHILEQHTGQPGQMWPTVEALYDSMDGAFSQWSDGVTTRTRPAQPVTGNLDVTALYVRPIVTATYNISGHGTIPNGVLQVVSREVYQQWPDVTAPADGGGTVFSQWSDGVLTRTRNDGTAVITRPPVTALYAPPPPPPPPPPPAYSARVTFETTALPSGISMTGATRALEGGVVCSTRNLRRFNQTTYTQSTALGQWYAFNPTGTISLTTTGTPWEGYVSFFYNAGADVTVWAEVNGNWDVVDVLGPVDTSAQSCSRNNWWEYIINLNGPCTGLYFEGVANDLAIDNITLGHNDALGPLPT